MWGGCWTRLRLRLRRAVRGRCLGPIGVGRRRGPRERNWCGRRLTFWRGGGRGGLVDVWGFWGSKGQEGEGKGCDE